MARVVKRSCGVGASHLRVGITGMGTAGMAAALFIARRTGADVTVFERTPDPGAVGAGLGIQPIGLTVMKRLGLLDQVLDRGARIDRLWGSNDRGRDVLDLTYADLDPRLHGVGLHRGVLFDVLHRACIAEPNVSLETGCVITDAKVKGTATAAPPSSESGSYFVDAAGDKLGPFDILVCADGRGSRLRHNMGKASGGVWSWDSPYPYGCLWTLLPDEGEVFTRAKTLRQHVSSFSSTKMLGFMPTGKGPKTAAGAAGAGAAGAGAGAGAGVGAGSNGAKDPDTSYVSLFWSLPMSAVPSFQQGGAAQLAQWKEEVLSMEPRAEAALGHVRTVDDLIPAGYSDTVMARYDFGDMVFLGDAAHATSPQLGQGANLALVDAWVLGECLAESPGDVTAALARYTRARRWRLFFYQTNSRILTPVFQSGSTAVGTLRDVFMGPLCHFPPTQLQMLTVMCGAQNNGWPWTTIPKDEYLGFLGDAGE